VAQQEHAHRDPLELLAQEHVDRHAEDQPDHEGDEERHKALPFRILECGFTTTRAREAPLPAKSRIADSTSRIISSLQLSRECIDHSHRHTDDNGEHAGIEEQYGGPVERGSATEWEIAVI